MFDWPARINTCSFLLARSAASVPVPTSTNKTIIIRCNLVLLIIISLVFVSKVPIYFTIVILARHDRLHKPAATTYPLGGSFY